MQNLQNLQNNLNDMSDSYFRFKQFTINQDRSAFKVGTDGVLLGACAEIGRAGKILDIGAGTGLITIMLAQRSSSEIFAIEPDYDSYVQAAGNIKACKWSDRITIFSCRLQDYFPAGMKFDLIVSNPPYFIESLRNPISAEAFARHDVSLTQEDLLEGAARLLGPEGRFQVIMPYTEGTILIASAPEYGLYCNSIIKIKPVLTSEIKRLIISFGKRMLPATERFLTIEKGRRHDFTEEYINITKDFYLKF